MFGDGCIVFYDGVTDEDIKNMFLKRCDFPSIKEYYPKLERQEIITQTKNKIVSKIFFTNEWASFTSAFGVDKNIETVATFQKIYNNSEPRQCVKIIMVNENVTGKNHLTSNHTSIWTPENGGWKCECVHTFNFTSSIVEATARTTLKDKFYAGWRQDMEKIPSLTREIKTWLGPQ